MELKNAIVKIIGIEPARHGVWVKLECGHTMHAARYHKFKIGSVVSCNECVSNVLDGEK